MKRKYEFYTTGNQRLIDALIAALSFYLSFQIRFDWSVPPRHEFQLWLFLPAMMLARVLVNDALGLYRQIWRYVSLTDAIRVGRAYALFSTLLLALRLSLPDSMNVIRFPVSVIVIELLLSAGGSLAVRALRRILYERKRSRKTQSAPALRVLLVGAGSIGARVSQELRADPRVKVVGFLDDDPKKAKAQIAGVDVLGPVGALPSVVRSKGVDQVVICITRPVRGQMKRLWALCEGLPVNAKIVPTIEEVVHGGSHLASFRDIQMADLLGREVVEWPDGANNLGSVYSQKRVLITGAGGSIGSELARQLLALDPARLILLDKDENGLHEVFSDLIGREGDGKVVPIVAEIRNTERLRSVFCRYRPEIVFHAAAHKHVPLMQMNPGEAILNNVVGTRNVADLSLELGVSAFVLISTDKAVRPRSVMGASKRICEMLIQARGRQASTRFSCVRFGNVLGSRGSVIPLFQKQIARGGPVTITHPEVKRFLMVIPEAVRLVLQAGTLASSGEIFVLDMGDPVQIIDLARDLIEMSGLRPGADVEIEVRGLRPGEKLSEDLVDPSAEVLLPTAYEKIKLARGQEFDRERFERNVNALIEAARRDSAREIYDTLLGFPIGFDGRESPELLGEPPASSAAGKT